MMREIFFAYQSASKSKNSDNVDAIERALSIVNSGTTFQGKTWQDLQINGRVLINTIFEAIDNCDVFACDLTYLNHNVLFELGYAIAKNKTLFILLNNRVHNASANFSNISILKTVGYSSFTDANDIVEALKKVPEKPQLLQDLEIADKKIKVTNDIFYIRNTSGSQAEFDTSKYLDESNLKVIYDDATEVEYRPFSKYLEYILNSSCTIVHVTSSDVSSAFEENAKASLLAGFACGREKSVLLLAPFPYQAPVDYVDIMIQYRSASDCVMRTRDWVEKNIEPLDSRQITEEDTELDLLKLGLGYDIAENEKDELENYFVRINAYDYAMNHNRAFFIGRKGTGKTAVYIMLNKALLAPNDTYVIDLKPESSELLNNVEVARLYQSVAQKQSFFHTIWKFVIYGKLALQIVESLQKPFIESESFEHEFVDFVNSNHSLLSQHFLEVLNHISVHDEPNQLQKVYVTLLNPLANYVRSYFEKTKYQRIAIIADNLDKTWDIKNDLDIQTSMILSLFEVTGQIESHISSRHGQRVDIKVILFLRKDIFDYILRHAREPDKLILNKQEIDWAKNPNQLKLLIEKRFEYVLSLKSDDEIAKVWDKYFAVRLQPNKSVFSKIMEACIPRPRDLLMFMRNMFESAVNNGNSKVLEEDFEKALEEYSSYLYQNLVAEMVSEYPNIRNLLDRLHSGYIDRIEYVRLKEEALTILDDKSKLPQLINSLMENGYFRLSNSSNRIIYASFFEAEEEYQKKCKKIWFFTYRPRRTTIDAVFTPQYKRLTKQGRMR